MDDERIGFSTKDVIFSAGVSASAVLFRGDATVDAARFLVEAAAFARAVAAAGPDFARDVACCLRAKSENDTFACFGGGWRGDGGRAGFERAV